MDSSLISPSALLRYDSVVRLTQYVPAEKPAVSQEVLISEWRKDFGSSSTEGVVYRELCRQVPEWSELAKREIDNPIQATFIEYMIVEPWVDLSKLPSLPNALQASYSAFQDVHSVAFHFGNQGHQQTPRALMFNLFEIDGPAGMEQAFLMAWPPRGEFKINEPATISTVLHQRMLPVAGIKAFNRAEITSAEGGADRMNMLVEAALCQASCGNRHRKRQRPEPACCKMVDQSASEKRHAGDDEQCQDSKQTPTCVRPCRPVPA